MKAVSVTVLRPVLGASYTWNMSEVARRVVLVALPKQSMVILLLRDIFGYGLMDPQWTSLIGEKESQTML